MSSVNANDTRVAEFRQLFFTFFCPGIRKSSITTSAFTFRWEIMALHQRKQQCREGVHEFCKSGSASREQRSIWENFTMSKCFVSSACNCATMQTHKRSVSSGKRAKQDIYTTITAALNLECSNSPKMRFHCARQREYLAVSHSKVDPMFTVSRKRVWSHDAKLRCPTFTVEKFIASGLLFSNFRLRKRAVRHVCAASDTTEMGLRYQNKATANRTLPRKL